MSRDARIAKSPINATNGGKADLGNKRDGQTSAPCWPPLIPGSAAIGDGNPPDSPQMLHGGQVGTQAGGWGVPAGPGESSQPVVMKEPGPGCL